jgi:hypothetical protein
MNNIKSRAVVWGWILACGGVFGYSNLQLSHYAREFPDQEIEVILPRFVQVILTGGDRHLAANVGVVRSLLNPSAKDNYDHFITQAKIQQDVAWLNPRHEDNYYVAAAMLSWSGHSKEAENILELAANGRPFDSLPAFFLGFDYFYFDQNPIVGAQWMYEAAKRADGQNRIAFSRIAARWAERGQDAKEALRVIQLMKEQARGNALRDYLTQRAARVEGLILLQEAANDYRAKFKRPLKTLDELIQAGVIKQIPQDPAGLGYMVNAQGIPQLVQPASRLKPPPKQENHSE